MFGVPGEGVVGGVVAGRVVEAPSDRVEPFDPASAPDDELLARVARLEARRTAIDLDESRLLAELEVRGTCDRERGLSTGAWLAHQAKLPGAVAKSRIRVASALRQHLTLVARALDSGSIGWEHARVLTELLNPRILDDVVANQELLLGLADRCRFEQWRAEVRALARLWDQDGGYDPNEDVASNRLSFGRTMDGLTTLAATLTGDHAEVVTQAIDAKADELQRRARKDAEASPDLPVPARRTLRALALTEIVREALATDADSSTPARPEVTLVVGADDPTSATDPDGVALADGTTRVLRCDADIRPLVVDSLGVPLDLGRQVRLATDGQRRAVRRRDGGCVFPGCASRVVWCDVHHCIRWDGDGVTDLCNLVCLCRHHHGVVHRRGWRVWLDRDGWAAFRSLSGATFWGQRHGRSREGPPPDPLTARDADHPHVTGAGPRPGVAVVDGRFHRLEDPLVRAEARQLVRHRLTAA